MSRQRTPSRSVLRLLSACVALGCVHFTTPVAFAQQANNFAGRPAGSRAMTWPSPEAAYNFGFGALRSGQPEMAVKALEYAADRDVVLAQYYLARIYGDNSLSYTDHGRAFDLFREIVEKHIDVDIDEDALAPFVAKSMVALAGYYRTGITASEVSPNLEQAASLLRHAATTLRDEDAQFEFAKMLIKGEGLKAQPHEGVRLLRELSKHGHASAQAFLADLYWRGNHVPRDPYQAYLLITLAIENAPAAERIWIEDSYQHIFCGAGEGVRKQAQGSVADWRNQYGRRREVPQRELGGIAEIQPRASRTCSNGLVVPLQRDEVAVEPARRGAAPVPNGYVAAPMPGTSVGASANSAAGFTIRDAGQLSLSPRQ